MNGEFSPQWLRLNTIIDKSGLTVGGFAKHCGRMGHLRHHFAMPHPPIKYEKIADDF